MAKIFSQDWVKILVVFVAWQALIWTAAGIFTQDQILPFEPSYLRTELVAGSSLPQFVSRLAGFDGVYYLMIAEKGYFGTGSIQAFFPLYPLLVQLLTELIGNMIVAGLVVSMGCLYGFLLLTWRLLREKYGAKIAWWSLAIFLLLPASFFLGVVYSESLFLLLLVATFYAYERQKYWLVAVTGALLSATRIIGVVAPAAIGLDLLIKAWKEKRLKQPQTWVNLGVIALGATGLLAYMGYLWWRFDDPLFFMTVQSSFGAGRETSTLVLLPQVWWRYIKMFVIGLPLDLKTYAIGQELLVSLAYLAGIVVAGWQNWRARQEIYPWSWWIFSLVAYIIPTLTGNLSSMTRYTLPCLVVTLLLAKTLVGKKSCGYLFLLLSGGIMLFNLLLFVQGYWVA